MCGADPITNHQLVDPAVPVRQHAAPFERAHHLARGAQLARHAERGFRLGGGEIDVDLGGEKQVVAPRLVHEGRARRARGEHVVQRGQVLEFDLDRRDHVLRLGQGRRDAHGDRLADVAHLVGGEHRLQRRLEAGEGSVGADRRHAVEIGGDDHALANGRRDAERLDAGVRARAAQERDVAQMRQRQVADELSAAAQVAVVLLADEPRANALSGHALSRLRVARGKHLSNCAFLGQVAALPIS